MIVPQAYICMPLRCVIHGSFRQHFAQIREASELFRAAGVEVVAPSLGEFVGAEDGFLRFAGEEGIDRRVIELKYLHHVKRLGKNGFSYFCVPEGYIGKTTSYELGIAQVTNIPCFFSETPFDHPVYAPKSSIWSASSLATYICEHGTLPPRQLASDECLIDALWQDLMVPGSVVATGGMIEYRDPRSSGDPELLFVKTHKWGGRYSMIGGKVRRNETLLDALKREIREETGLESKTKEHLRTFDQFKNSGYYDLGTQHIFVDCVVEVLSKKVQLNEEAESYVWMPAKEALASLNVEPNARHTLELYLTTKATA